MSGRQFTDQNFQQEVLGEMTKPVLVDFWASWCGPCKVQGPIIEELAKEMSEKVSIGSLEVDENPATAQQYGIMSIPTLAIFKGGKEVWRVAGLQQKQAIIEELKRFM